MDEVVGRRERKKARTRQALADAALEMFLDRGYEQVGVRDVADAADVSVSTLFKYFPSKEALVFDLADDLSDDLMAAVRDRKRGQSIPQALRDHVRTRVAAMTAVAHYPAFAHMVAASPALQDYSRRMWRRHEATLARTIADETDAADDDPTCAALALFALDIIDWAYRQPDPLRAVDAGFAVIEHGWTNTQST